MSREPLLEDGELARVLRLYEGPPQPRPVLGRAGSRPSRLALAALVLVIAAGSAAAAVGLVTGSGTRHHAALDPGGCITTLTLAGRRYVERAVGTSLPAPGRRLGSGVWRPCGSPTTTVPATALAGVDARRAVGVRGRRGVIYVAAPCARTPAAQLLACVRATP